MSEWPVATKTASSRDLTLHRAYRCRAAEESRLRKGISNSGTQQSAAVGILWRRQRRGQWPGGSANPLAYGAQHAERKLIDAMLTYLPQPVSVYARPRSLELARKHIKALVNPSHPQRVAAPLPSLLQDWSQGQVALWFNPTGDIASPLNFRSALGLQKVPVVSLHHTISYQHYLQVKFLLLLLSGSRPFDAIICSTHSAKQAIEQAIQMTSENLAASLGTSLSFSGKLPVLPLGVDTDVMRPREKESARAAVGLNNRKLVMLFLGRTSVFDKGDLLPWLRSMCRLPRLLQEQLVVVIAGEQEPDTATELARFLNYERPLFRIDARGFIPERAKPDFYSAADVFISPADSVQEMFGLAPLEAMACGVPQIVSDWDGYQDVIEDGKTGFLIPTVWAPCTEQIDSLSLLDFVDWQDSHFTLGQSVAVDCEAFLERIKLLLGNSKLRTRMSQQSRQRAVDLFSWPSIVRRYNELFESLIDEGRSCAKRSEECPNHFLPQPHYFELFRHFATRILGTSASLRPSAERFQDSQWAKRFPYPDFQDLNPDVLRLIDTDVAFGRGQRTVQEVLEICQRTKPCLEESVAWRHLMWLVKYGFVVAQ